MAIAGEAVAHADLVNGATTTLHAHAGGGGGPTIQHGVKTAVQSETLTTITFGTAFAVAPTVIVTLSRASASIQLFEYLFTEAITTTSFKVEFLEDGGESMNIHWMAIEP